MLRNKYVRNNGEYTALLAACLLASGCATLPLTDAGLALAPGQSMTQGDASRLAALAEKAIAEGRLVDGGNVYVSIVTAYPDDAQAWCRLATVYLRTQQYAAAQLACERAHLHKFRPDA